MDEHEMQDNLMKIVIRFRDSNPIVKGLVDVITVQIETQPVAIAFDIRLHLERYSQTCLIRIHDFQVERYTGEGHLAQWVFSQCIEGLSKLIFPVQTATIEKR